MKCIISLFKMNPGNLISAWFCLEYEPSTQPTTTKAFYRKWKAFGICVLFFSSVCIIYFFFWYRTFSDISIQESITQFFCSLYMPLAPFMMTENSIFSSKNDFNKYTRPENETFFFILYKFWGALFKKENIRKFWNHKIRNKHQI